MAKVIDCFAPCTCTCYIRGTVTLPIICALCGKPCDLETCKVTYDGKPVHADCIVAMLTEKKAKKS